MPRKKKFKPAVVVLGYLLRYGSISRATAWTHFDVVDLPAVICRIKRDNGYKFNRKGTGKDLTYTLPKVAEKYKGKQLDLSPEVQ